MSKTLQLCLSIAGFDPGAGAGVLSDIRTFEAHGVKGLGVCTSVTFQNDREFDGVKWLEPAEIKHQLRCLFRQYNTYYVKIGLIRDLELILEIVAFLKNENENVKIIWDPILAASAGYWFHPEIDYALVEEICSEITLITPNSIEVSRLTGIEDMFKASEKLALQCSVLLKGGHMNGPVAEDILYQNDHKFYLKQQRVQNFEMHGTGCILSAAILARLSKGSDLEKACSEAKLYLTQLMHENKSHKLQLT